MSIPKKLSSSMGTWSGTNRLHLGDWHPAGPLFTSDATAEVLERIGGQFLEIAYTWEFEGKGQEGLIILGGNNKTSAVNAFWTDSWHMAHQTMLCEGSELDDGSISVKGNYKVEGHPDWGWRSEINVDGDKLEYKMFNVSPEGEETIAVEMEMKRN